MTRTPGSAAPPRGPLSRGRIPAGSTPPGRVPALRRWARLLRREVVAVPAAALVLSGALTWPALRHPGSTLPEDLGDPALVTYLLAWAGHALRVDPTGLWNTSAFYPERGTLAFTDSLLGYAPLGLIGSGPTAAVVRYNLLFVAVAALAFTGAYALTRQLGARWQGAAVAGAVFAFAPWRWTQAGHLHVLSTGGIALALALLARGHGYSFTGGYVPDRVRPGWAAAGWAVACWQLTLGFGIGLPFAYALALLCAAAAAGWLGTGRPRLPGRLLAADTLGGLTFALVGVLMALPYLRVAADHPGAVRTVGDLTLYSPPLRGFFIAPDDSLPWGAWQAGARAGLPYAPEMALLPGLVVLALAAAGLLVSAWSRRQRLTLAAATVVATVLAMGTEAPGGGEYSYLLLFDHLPGWEGLRTPGRLVIWVTLGLCLLAAGLVSAAVDALRRHGTTRLVRLALVVPVLAVVAEGLNTTPHVPVPAAPAALAGLRGPLLVLPSTVEGDPLVLLWTTAGFPAVVNGSSGFTPLSQRVTREVTTTFPDAASLARLRNLGVRTVVVRPDQVASTPWKDVLARPITGLPVERRTVGDVVVYTLR
jgi:hypothetical protein